MGNYYFDDHDNEARIQVSEYNQLGPWINDGDIAAHSDDFAKSETMIAHEVGHKVQKDRTGSEADATNEQLVAKEAIADNAIR